MIATFDTPVGAIVAEDFRAAAVLDRFGIDFCCGGTRTLGEACRERAVNPSEVVKEVERACSASETAGLRFAEWEPESLMAYIVSRHHAYVRRALPGLAARTNKLAASHGPRHPELLRVTQLFKEVAAEMTSHMAKEESVLFPYIAALAEAVRRGTAPPCAPFGSIDNPIRMMEADHETAGNAMSWIRTLTNDFTPPSDACPTWRVCLQELEAFERDLHTHVHLENNILFLKARRLAASAGERAIG
jgi:regulator of cell morphogenesis and NO signaling